MALVLLGTEGCHLCEQAQALLLNLNGKIPCNLYLEDIAESEDMVARYGERIPVLKYEAEEGDMEGPEIDWPFSEQDVLRFIQKIA
tara:strand:- start:47 stop:304 length:258 start_codon:yes stop_codon:yes gene_type:complete